MKSAMKSLDELFSRIRSVDQSIHKISKQADEQIEKIRQQYKEGIETLKKEAKSADKEILKLMKEHKKELFGEKERIDLKYGSAMRLISNNVKRAKGVLKRLEEMKITDVIEISKRVKWNELEKWDDERLASVGTSRIRKERFIYEIRSRLL